MRTCYRCGETKADEDFHRHPKGRGGRRNICKVCANRESSVRHAAWRATDPERKRAGQRERYAKWRENHPERARELGRESQRRWAATHPQQAKEKWTRTNALRISLEHDAHLTEEEWAALRPLRRAHSEALWRASHPDERRRARARRRAREAGAQGEATAAQIRQRWLFYGGRCWMCGAPATAMDHVIPLAGGGSDWPSNQRPACGFCNSSKGDRDYRPFLALAG